MRTHPRSHKWRFIFTPLAIVAALAALMCLQLAMQATSVYHPPATAAVVRSTRAPNLAFQLGDIFAGVGQGHILHFQPSGALVETLDTGSLAPEDTGMCFDGAGSLYTTNFAADNMTKFDNFGTRLTFPWGGPFSLHPESCVVDASSNIYVGEVDGNNRITKYTSSGAFLASWQPATTSRGLDWIDLAADQCTMYYTSEGSTIKRFNVCTNTQLPDFASGLPIHCYALRIRSNGEVMVACQTELIRISSGGVVLQHYPTTNYPGTSFFFAANLDPNGTSVWTGDYPTGLLYKINIATGAAELHFVAQPQGTSMAGLAVFGELTQGQPTATPGPPPDTATPAPTVTAEVQPSETPAEQPSPTPAQSTPTEVQRTHTPHPSNTPHGTQVPTNTPLPTQTPGGPTATTIPTNTNTPVPSTTTNTPLPTQTPGGPTATTVPPNTSTPIPADTNTPLPTQTPGGPTATSVPADTSTLAPPTATACPIQFSDVPANSTFYPYIRCMACRGIINGYTSGCGTGNPCFRPANNVTRGQLSKIVSNAAGFSDPQPNQMFQDVPLGTAFQLFIGRLASRGFISGYACGAPGEPCVAPGNLPYFRPDNDATRGQISKIDSNSAGFNDTPTGQQFQDVAPGSAYYTYTYRLSSRAIMGGYPCGGPGEPCDPNNLPYFRPNNDATRGQTAKIVSNTFFPNCVTPSSPSAAGR
jgi:hypothetical protein